MAGNHTVADTPMRKVVLVLGLRGAGRDCLAFACRTALANNARLLLLLTVPAPEFNLLGRISSFMRDDLRQQAERVLERTAAQACGFLGTDAETVLREGEVCHQLLDFLESSPDVAMVLVDAALPRTDWRCAPRGGTVEAMLSERISVPVTLVPDRFTQAAL
jgi:hypothetical protein